MSRLSVVATEDGLVISIGIDELMHAIEYGPYFQNFSKEEFKITDKKVFLKEIVRCLKSEEEDGSTPVHRMLDQAAELAVEFGCEGVEFND